MSSRVKTDFLASRPTAASGAAHLVDIFGGSVRYNVSTSPDEADALALWADLLIVGDELVDATEDVRRQHDDREHEPEREKATA